MAALDASRSAAIAAVLDGVRPGAPLRFTTDAAESAALWNVRKGMFPAVGAMRPTGTTVIIEDVAFPVERLAEATLDLQQLLGEHGYHEAIIFGHALEGNLHFVFTQDFGSAAEVRALPPLHGRAVRDGGRELRRLAEGRARHRPQHGALRRAGMGRRGVCRRCARIKALLDPDGLLNPGVILNDDPRSPPQDLKPLPAADPLVDKCIECGFCEPKCPSHGLTLSPRQRIVGWREIARLDADGSEPERAARAEGALRLPRHRDLRRLRSLRDRVSGRDRTGLFTKALRGRRQSRLTHRLGDIAGRYFGGTLAAARLRPGAVALSNRTLGHAALAGWPDMPAAFRDGRRRSGRPCRSRQRLRRSGRAILWDSGDLYAELRPPDLRRVAGAPEADGVPERLTSLWSRPVSADLPRRATRALLWAGVRETGRVRGGGSRRRKWRRPCSPLRQRTYSGRHGRFRLDARLKKILAAG